MNILLILHTYAADRELGSFAQQLVKGFESTGASIHVIRANDLVDTLGARSLSTDLDANKVKTFFKENKFDLVFNTNHAGIGGVVKKQIGQTPVISWLVDRNPFLHGGSEKKLFSRTHHVITSSRANVENLREKFNLQTSNVHYLPFMTNPASFSHDRKKSINICFIGSYFVNEAVISKLLLHNYEKKYFSRILAAIASLENDFDQDDAELVEKLGIRLPLLVEGVSTIRFKGAIGNIISNKKRVEYLSSVSDSGLHLYGTENISNLAFHYPKLARCFHSSEFINTRERLCDIYDKSRIGLNINHHQATTGLGYRVFDILASSALLVTNKQQNSDLDYLFGENHPIPVYSSKQELKRVCEHFLNHDQERVEITQICNNLVADKHTFDTRAMEIIKIAYPDFKGLPETVVATFVSKRDLIKDSALAGKNSTGYGLKDGIQTLPKLVSYVKNKSKIR